MLNNTDYIISDNELNNSCEHAVEIFQENSADGADVADHADCEIVNRE